MSRPVKLGWALGAVGVLVVAFAVALVILLNKNSDANDRIDELQGQVQGSGEEGSDLGARVEKLEQCLPEIQSEIDSMTYDPEFDLISPSVQVSQFCSEVVYGQPPAGE